MCPASRSAACTPWRLVTVASAAEQSGSIAPLPANGSVRGDSTVFKRRETRAEGQRRFGDRRKAKRQASGLGEPVPRGRRLAASTCTSPTMTSHRACSRTSRWKAPAWSSPTVRCSIGDHIELDLQLGRPPPRQHQASRPHPPCHRDRGRRTARRDSSSSTSVTSSGHCSSGSSATSTVQPPSRRDPVRRRPVGGERALASVHARALSPAFPGASDSVDRRRLRHRAVHGGARRAATARRVIVRPRRRRLPKPPHPRPRGRRRPRRPRPCARWPPARSTPPTRSSNAGSPTPGSVARSSASPRATARCSTRTGSAESTAPPRSTWRRARNGSPPPPS